ncbi:hypothetical protein HF521_013082 [Silurus meridionalis]|uniref:C-type lectin domain-containing protein n=1 Tax=Silurus meridionalis TaxID=175797 RepID=A0A8T0AEJ0_SILME|nr:hypothetical protein HF521_013082 [Silurus meridionalis]
MSGLISITLLLSVFGIEAYIPHRYFFVNENKTWIEAQAYCRQTYTDLATINTMKEMNHLKDILKKEKAGRAWFGLQRGATEKWQWSHSDQPFYKDGDAFRNWNTREPNNGHGPFCAEMNTDPGFWNDDHCEKLKPFVCYEEKEQNVNEYIWINDSKAWYDAQSYCRDHYIDLVNVRSQTENQKLWNLTKFYIWIGLFKDSWTWSDESNSSFRYWRSASPTGNLNCSVMKMNDPCDCWNVADCNEKLPFVCHDNKLILIKQNLTWWEALKYCRSHHHDLVSVSSEEMQLWVKKTAQKADTAHVWLGLRHDCVQRIWFWVFGTMLCYQDWAPGNGTWNEDCSQERRSGAVQAGGTQQWIELHESYKLNFICSTYDGES